MIGLFELGNSFLKYTVSDGKDLGEIKKIVYSENDEGLLTALNQAFALLPKFETAWLASVASKQVSDKVGEALTQAGHKLSIINTKVSLLGVENAYKQADRLGVDRWLNLIAVKRQYNSAAIIIDAGTALTIDVIDATGKHLGGFISPGLKLMRKSLIENTNFEYNEIKFKAKWALACDTESAVLRGTLYSIVSWVDRIVSNIELNNNDKFIRVISGGDAALLVPLLDQDSKNNFKHLKTKYIIDTNLTFSGMLSVAKSKL